MKTGNVVGPWTLRELLGRGGNSEVWRAQGTNGLVALKILRVSKPESERYKRFRHEVEILRRLEGGEGILPLLDAYIPTSPTRQDPAWLAMPEALLIRSALADAKLEVIVQAVAAIAQTLTRLANQHIFHRDIKPENLYRYADSWVVGDFGLVEFPNKEAMTEVGRKLGPMHYFAPEMLLAPESAEGGPADVYSLVKTLWVLATGQRFPPPGEQRQDTVGVRISDYLEHPHAALIDRLIQHGTRFDPSERPTMAGVADELTAWLELQTPVTKSPTDLSDLDAKIKSVFGPEKSSQDARKAWEAIALVLSSQMYDRVMEIGGELASRGLPSRTTQSGATPSLASYLPRASITGGATLLRGYGAETTVVGPAPKNVTLRIAAGLQLFDDGTLDAAAAHLIGAHGLVQDDLWSLTRTVPVDSAQQHQAIGDLLEGLSENVPQSVAELIRRVEED